MFKRIEQNQRRVIIVGDIHGCLTKLLDSLELIDYVPDSDILVSVGDLIDRGTENLETLEWFESGISGGNVHMVRGNHDDFLIEFAEVQAQYPGRNLPSGISRLWFNNGGGWASEVSEEVIQHHAQWLKEQPLMIEIGLDSGITAGVVHAETWDAWDVTKSTLDSGRTIQRLTWGRTKIHQHQEGHSSRAEGINVLFCGHSVVEEATAVGNQVYLDTGAVFDTIYNTGIPGRFTFAIFTPNSKRCIIHDCSTL